MKPRKRLYTEDRAGNRTQQVATVGGVPTTTNYTYNNANQLTSGGATYDANGNLTNDGMNAYAWDRANRLLSMGGANHKYDGQGHRVQQTVGATVTKYLLDLQPGLSLVLSQDVGGSVTRHVHAVRGIHAHKDATTNWEYMAQDGLGSVRSVTNKDNGVLWNTNYDGYGNPFGAVGTAQTPYGFTGEIVDGGGLLDVRARRYNPMLGILPSLDPFEGVRDRAMSLNGYSWVEGNVVNMGDPSGASVCSLVTLPDVSSYEICKAKCLNSFIFGFPLGNMKEYSSCLGKCEPLKHMDVAKNATVMIALTGDASGAGEKPCTQLELPPAETSLGAISIEVVWTHDHNSGPAPYYGLDPSNQSEAKAWFKLWPCITFTGAAGKGKVTIAGKDIKIGNSVAGTLLLEDAQIASDGRHINLSQLGIAVVADKNWKPGQQSSVFVAHVIGSNTDNNKWLDHNNVGVLPFDVNTGKPVNFDGQGRPFYETNLRSVSDTGGEYIWGGDSGGGVFYNDRLIGVNFRDLFDANPPTVTGLLFVPVS